jgi:hypothetical protein
MFTGKYGIQHFNRIRAERITVVWLCKKNGWHKDKERNIKNELKKKQHVRRPRKRGFSGVLEDIGKGNGLE